MNIKSFLHRFKEVRDKQVGKDIGLNRKMLYYFKWFYAYITQGASINDYFVYRFFDLNRNGRKKYITYSRHKKIQQICNPDKKAIQICRDKIQFNQLFKDELGRKWIDVTNSSKEEIEVFLKDVKSENKLFLKEVEGFRGSSVFAINPPDQNYDFLIKKLSQDPEGHYILEEAIIQSGEMKDFHPWSINTIRIVTIYDDKADIVHLMDASIRVGNNKNHVDNLHYHGISAGIDIKTGIIYFPGFDSENNHYLVHPLTGKQIMGFKVPYWEECKKYVEQAARKIPHVRYIGWDIVSKGDGTFCLIEANDNADHDIQQIPQGPLWPEYKKILKTLK